MPPKALALSQHAAEYFWVGMTWGEASRELGEGRAVTVVAQGGVSEGRLRGITRAHTFLWSDDFILGKLKRKKKSSDDEVRLESV